MERYLQVASIAGRDAGLLLRRHASPPLDRLIPRKADDPRATVTIATRAPNVVECNADGRVGIAALHGQVKVDHRVAGVAGDDEPVMLRRERSGYCRPEPRGLLRGQAR